MIKKLTIAAIAAMLFIGCKNGPCSNCRNLPLGSEVFVGQWRWEFSVMRSNLRFGDLDTVILDTIWPTTYGTQATLEIKESGCLQLVVGDDCYGSCIETTLVERQEPSPFVCQDVIGMSLPNSDFDYSAYSIVNCSQSDSLKGVGIYHSQKSFLPIPDLPPSYELAGFWNYYSRL